MRKALILGGTDQIGIAVAAKLNAQGWQVVLGSRGNQTVPQHLINSGVERVGLDRSEYGAIGFAIKDGCDLLLDTVAFDEFHTKQLLEVQRYVGQIIAVSSASVYRDDQGRTLD